MASQRRGLLPKMQDFNHEKPSHKPQEKTSYRSTARLSDHQNQRDEGTVTDVERAKETED